MFSMHKKICKHSSLLVPYSLLKDFFIILVRFIIAQQNASYTLSLCAITMSMAMPLSKSPRIETSTRVSTFAYAVLSPLRVLVDMSEIKKYLFEQTVIFQNSF